MRPTLIVVGRAMTTTEQADSLNSLLFINESIISIERESLVLLLLGSLAVQCKINRNK